MLVVFCWPFQTSAGFLLLCLGLPHKLHLQTSFGCCCFLFVLVSGTRYYSPINNISTQNCRAQQNYRSHPPREVKWSPAIELTITTNTTKLHAIECSTKSGVFMQHYCSLYRKASFLLSGHRIKLCFSLLFMQRKTLLVSTNNKCNCLQLKPFANNRTLGKCICNRIIDDDDDKKVSFFAAVSALLLVCMLHPIYGTVGIVGFFVVVVNKSR